MNALLFDCASRVNINIEKYIENGDCSLIKEDLKKKDCGILTDNHGSTILHGACRHGHYEIVKRVIICKRQCE